MAKPDAVRGIAESLGPLIVRPDVQTPKRSDAQPPSRAAAQTPTRLNAQTSGRPDVQASGYLPPLRTDPNMSKKTLYLDTDAMTEAYRLYVDRNRRKKVTESGFIQSLINEYLRGDRG